MSDMPQTQLYFDFLKFNTPWVFFPWQEFLTETLNLENLISDKMAVMPVYFGFLGIIK